MNRVPHRPLSIGPLRAFEAVARRLSFSAAAEEMFLTQPAISRQIKALEEELGAPLFMRGTRRVELTGAGMQLLRGMQPLLQRLDGTVRQIRSARGRRHVSVATFASFASLWLLPRLRGFEEEHPDIDIRVSASDHMIDLDDPEIDLALRYCHPDAAPQGSTRLFDEIVTPCVSRALADQAERGHAPPLKTPADLARHTLFEEDDHRPSAEFLSWRGWLREQGLAQLEPMRWLYLNFTYQQVQGALAGGGVALGRLAMVGDSLARGDLVEPFRVAGRMHSPFAYWLVDTAASRGQRPEVTAFARWLLSQAAQTREQMAAGTAIAVGATAP
ncbi:MAG: LysR substrate-binding domain-containing protein [Aquincola sp.]|nr:LysR substrate-binding domain-containing protein [Aquincola sp.]MDH4289630.1 LysR substrate-binding domain-containing protein [Aquincola sp.]MDH5331376.1 LysR substrate-binding domain-containing protein [Aquincola sp.]